MLAGKMKEKIIANGTEISIIAGSDNSDFISLTDIAKYKTEENPGYIIQNWMRSRNVVQFLGLWEKLNNPNFNCLEFEAIENEAGEERLAAYQQGIVIDSVLANLYTKRGDSEQATIYRNSAENLKARYDEISLDFIKEQEKIQVES